jgi:hypothetical protein
MDSFPPSGNGGGFGGGFGTPGNGGCFGGGSGGPPNPKPDNSHIAVSKTRKDQYTRDKQYFNYIHRNLKKKYGEDHTFYDKYHNRREDFSPLYSKFNEFKGENPNLE